MNTQSPLSLLSDRYTRVVACATLLVSTAVIIHGQTFGYGHMTPCIWPLIASLWAIAWLMKSRQWNALVSKVETQSPSASRSIQSNPIPSTIPQMEYPVQLQKVKSPH